MEIKKYKLFIEKEMNIREDEYSHLNDDLNSRWDDSTYDPDDNYKYDDDYDYGDDDDYEDDYEDGDIIEDDMEHLLYLLRSMFKNSGIDVSVTNKKMNINIYILLTTKERLRHIITIFEIINKLKRDILIQYSCEFQMWENRQGRPYLDFDFIYESDDDDDPF